MLVYIYCILVYTTAGQRAGSSGRIIPKDKKTYQQDPANYREALREAQLDEVEGADIMMVKPGLPYLDVIRLLRDNSTLPIAAYHVSGEPFPACWQFSPLQPRGLVLDVVLPSLCGLLKAAILAA